MHIDNLEALNIIKSKLNIGKVTIEKDRNKCSFVVQDFIGIKDVICPIFIQFPLLTSPVPVAMRRGRGPGHRPFMDDDLVKI